MIRQRRGAQGQLRHAEACQVDYLEPRRRAWDLIFPMSVDGLSLQGIAHECDPLELRDHRAGGRHHVGESKFYDAPCYVWWKSQPGNGRLIYKAKHNGNGWPNCWSPTQDAIRSRRADPNN